MFVIGRIEVTKHGHYTYETARMTFDVRDLADLIPHFTAGETAEEHQSLMQMAACTPQGFLELVRQVERGGFNVQHETWELQAWVQAVDTFTPWELGVAI